MPSTHDSVWMTPQTRAALEAELADLLTVPHAADAESRTDRVVDAWLARKHRVREIHELLSRAGHTRIPPDDGVAEPGMVLTVRFDDTGDTETFLLGTRGTTDDELEVYTVSSPLGSALIGATPGCQCSYRLPTGRSQRVTLLAAVPFGAHRPAGAASRTPV
ncbi:GreA/GreB family elongation factor [Mycolicibacterium rufum]|uniref:GreA/GreB family elongation factor n=1 Tax=Mycolicibacterium rufum TaxID=318424 RepID=A0A9X2YJL6_9MYCO|nr:GreA/GreB family elongation factor [Mycolicibacterium rufum]KGI69620.1 gramicidin synthase [Mycolicibacterium rufum]MCV7073851.1 GreA/GreB family elongation factor [Mycolicibacterium rufum]ULP35854.1 GreA/GreB family elongation factor [Mycolicibacterium rufum]